MPRGIQKKYRPFGATPVGMLSNTEGAEGGGATPPATDPPAGTPEAQPPADGDDGRKGGHQAVLADLAKERDQRQALATQLEEMRTAQQQQMQALAAAFGLKPEEVPDTDKLAERVNGLETKLGEAEHRANVLEVANNHKITDPEDIKTLAAIADPAVMATVAARLAPAPDDPKMPPLNGGARQTPKQPAGSLGEAIAQRYASK